MKITTSEFILIEKSKIHATGVFAKKNIPKGTKIIEYVGNKITKAESEEIGDIHMSSHKNNIHENGAVYIFELNSKYDIDGNVPWNTAKYINHSCEPNCEVKNVKGHIWIISSRYIKKGEEISYNYGYDMEDFKDHPCHCKSKKCVGYIVAEEHWPKLKKILNRKKLAKMLPTR